MCGERLEGNGTEWLVNLKAVWLATKAAAPHLRVSGRGPSIVNSASVAGVHGTTSAIAYGASKAGVIQLTKSCAVALGPNIRVNAFLPGTIDTPMAQSHLVSGVDPAQTELRMTGTQVIPRFGAADEVAQVACFLASDAASFVTGYQRGRIQDESMLYEHKKHDGSLPIIGVNTFLNPHASDEVQTVELARASEEEKRSQVERLAAFHEKHRVEAEPALAKLKEAAASGSNTLSSLMDAVREGSMGQITSAFFEVGGQYRRNV